MNRLAVAYYPEHVSETQWVRDLERMRAAGIFLVRVFEFAWSRLIYALARSTPRKKLKL